MSRGAVDAVVTYGEPLPADTFVDRKTITGGSEARCGA